MPDVSESLDAISKALAEEFAGFTIDQFQSTEDKRRNSMTFEVDKDHHHYLFTFTQEFLRDATTSSIAETVKSLRGAVEGCASAQLLVRLHLPLEFISRRGE